VVKVNEHVAQLAEILKEIPKRNDSALELTHNEVINKYITVFHLGPYFYVIYNTVTNKAEHVSEAIKHILGFDPDTFNIAQLFEKIHPEDLGKFNHFQKKAVEFFTNLPDEFFFKYKFSYDYRVLNNKEQYLRIIQQVVPIHYFPDGGSRTLNIFTDVTHLQMQGSGRLSFIGMDGAPSYFNVQMEDAIIQTEKYFTRRELEILKLIVTNKSTQEIADSLNISIHTVQTHRKNILRKSGSASMQDLIIKSVRQGWI
jgi:DNA-binding CsgD family transcriptional regulator